MSSESPAIEVENLGKCYRIQDRLHADDRGMHALLERLIAAPFHRPSRREDPTARSRREVGSGSHETWVLRHVSFEVARGEVLGIVGRNGAGKSVLLKILSRVTLPSQGRARIRGRVGAMLEAGAGFHPELTGRENVYLTGAILGMTRMEIERKFDDIVRISGIDEYLDTPVKRYSSGMGVRLAFAVVAHLDTEVMLFDEVLAMGDDGFRRQCAAMIRSLADAGRTVLFVSHDLDAIPRICDRAVMLEDGRIVHAGSSAEVVERHRASTSATP